MGNADNIRKTTWQITFNGTDLGFSDDISPDLKLTTEPIKVGSMGKAVIGKRIVGLEGKIKAQLRETEGLRAKLLPLMLPWAGADGSISLTPPVNVDYYTYCKTLVLHPEDMGTDKSEDIVLVKAAPMGMPNLKRNNDKDDQYDVEWEPMPDRSKFPAVWYGWIGDSAVEPALWTP